MIDNMLMFYDEVRARLSAQQFEQSLMAFGVIGQAMELAGQVKLQRRLGNLRRDDAAKAELIRSQLHQWSDGPCPHASFATGSTARSLVPRFSNLASRRRLP